MFPKAGTEAELPSFLFCLGQAQGEKIEVDSCRPADILKRFIIESF
jgi:hypothetical protein